MTKVTINPARLTWCLNFFNITPQELSHRLSFQLNYSHESISLTVKQLTATAQYFNKGPLFFLNPSPVEEDQLHSPQFRTINNQKPALSPDIKILIERTEQQRKRHMGLWEELSLPLKHDWKHHPAESKDIPAWLNLDKARNFIPIRRAVEDKGILVLVTKDCGGKWQIDKNNPLRGFSLYYEELPVIVIKKQASEAAQTFTLMHELGHLLLHKESHIDDEDDFYSYQGREKEANEFAGSVLIPDAVLNRIGDLPEDEKEYDDFLEIWAKTYGVSVEVILRRLLIHNRIAQKDYAAYRAYKSEQVIRKKSAGNRKNRHREPVPIFGEPFVNAVLDAYHTGRITLSKASSYLDNIKISGVHELKRDHE